MGHTLDQLSSGKYSYEPKTGCVLSYDQEPKVRCICVTDTRFHNEFSMLKKRGAFTVLVRRSGVDSADVHESERWAREAAANEVDLVVDNNGSFGELLAKARHVYAQATQGDTSPCTP